MDFRPLSRFGVFALFLGAGCTAWEDVASAKPFRFEGYVEPASSPYDADATHVLREEPDGPIVAALLDTRGRLSAAPWTRQTVLGKPAPDRIANDLPMLVVEEVWPAHWSYPRNDLCPVTAAAWAGCGSSLYPSIAEEPFPRGGSSVTSPPNPLDSDGDGVPDSSDAFPFDPTETTDTDHDGTGNNADPDDDNDGMPDLYEIANGLNRLLNDAAADLDGDGSPNGDEYVAGTAANDADSFFAVKEIQVDASGNVHLSWTSSPDRIYTVHYAPAPGGIYQPIVEAIASMGSITTTVIPAGDLSAAGFFRIEVLYP